jgi:hypothetical protein
MDRSKEYGYAVMRNIRVQRKLETSWTGAVWKEDKRMSRYKIILWTAVAALCVALTYT